MPVPRSATVVCDREDSDPCRLLDEDHRIWEAPKKDALDPERWINTGNRADVLSKLYDSVECFVDGGKELLAEPLTLAFIPTGCLVKLLASFTCKTEGLGHPLVGSACSSARTVSQAMSSSGFASA